MRLFLFVFAGFVLLAGIATVGYGVMVGFGGGITQAQASNRILAWAIPGFFGSAGCAVALGVAAARMKN